MPNAIKVQNVGKFYTPNNVSFEIKKGEYDKHQRIKAPHSGEVKTP